MTEKRNIEYGAISQSYSLRIKYEQFTNEKGLRAKTVVEQEVSLCIEPYRSERAFFMQDLLDFQKRANGIMRDGRMMMKLGYFVEFELVICCYEDVPEYDIQTSTGPIKSSLHQIAFDRWFYEGRGEDLDMDDEEGGLYLRPDTKYTEEHHDIYIPWNQDILEGLAGAHL